MLAPSSCGVLVLPQLIYHRGEKTLMIRKVRIKYLLYALLLPLIYLEISYSIYALIYGSSVLGENML